MITIDKFCRVIAPSSLPLYSLLVLLFCSAPAPAQTPAVPLARLTSPNADWALADFDGDRKPDLAIAEISGGNVGYRIRLRLSSSGETSHFDVAPGELRGLSIRAQDVDGDHDLDLVITAGIAGQPVGIWLNDGAGNFRQGDSSLYPQSIWRAPPMLLARALSGELPSARPEQSRSPHREYPAGVCELPTAGPRRAELALHINSPFLPGPWRVRPPPAV